MNRKFKFKRIPTSITIVCRLDFIQNSNNAPVIFFYTVKRIVCPPTGIIKLLLYDMGHGTCFEKRRTPKRITHRCLMPAPKRIQFLFNEGRVHHHSQSIIDMNNLSRLRILSSVVVRSTAKPHVKISISGGFRNLSAEADVVGNNITVS